MIPFVIPAALKAIPWRLVGYGVAIGALLLLGWRVHAWREGYKALPAVQDALKREEGCLPDSKCNERQKALEARQAEVTKEVVDGYETELARLRERPPAPVVRLCKPASRGAVRVPVTPSGADGTPSGGELPVEVGKDIGQQLFDLADDADREALKLKFLQDFNRALADSPRSP